MICTKEKLANYIQERIAGTLYGSVVMNRIAVAARIWQGDSPRIEPNPIDAIRWGVQRREAQFLAAEGAMRTEAVVEDHFSRQVLAFGKALQEKLKRCRIGVIGVGGLGGIVVEMPRPVRCRRLGAPWTMISSK